MADFSISGMLLLDNGTFKKSVSEAKGFFDNFSNSVSNKKINSPEFDTSTLAQSAKNLGGTLTKTLSVPIASALGGSIAIFKDYESELNALGRISDTTGPELEKLGDGFKNMSSRIPVSTNELLKTAQAAASLGVRRDDLGGFTETMAKMSIATGISANEVASAMGHIGNSFGKTSDSMAKSGQDYNAYMNSMGSSVAALADTYAASEGEILGMTTRLSGYSKVVGMSEQDTLAMATTMSSLGISAEEGASAMGQAMTKMNTAVSSGGETLDLFAQVSGMSAEKFAQTWKKKPAAAVSAFIEGLGNMQKSGEDTSGILEALGLGGLRTSDVINRMAGNEDLLNAALKTSNDSWKDGSKLQEEYDASSQTLSAQIELLKNAFVNLASAIGEKLAPYVSKFVRFLTDLTNKFQSLSPQTQDFIVKVSLLVAAIGPAIFIFGSFLEKANVVKDGVKSLGGGIKALGDKFLGAKSPIDNVSGSIEGVGQKSSENKGLISQLGDVIKSLGDGIKSVFEGVGDVIKDFGVAIKDVLDGVGDVVKSFGDAFATAFEGIGRAISMVPPSTLLALGAAIGIVNVSLALLATQGEGVKAILEGLGSVVESFGKGIESVFKGVAKIIESVGKTIQFVLEGLGDVFSSIGGAIAKVIDAITDGFVKAGDGAEAAGRGFKAMADGLSAISSLGFLKVAGGMTSIADAIKKLGSASSSVNGSSSALMTLSSVLSSIGPVLSNASSSFKSFGNNLKMALDLLSTSATSSMERLKSSIVTGISSVKVSLSDGIKSLSLIKVDFSPLNASFTTAFSAISTIVREKLNEIKVIFSSSLSSLGSDSSASLSLVVNSFQSAFTSVSSIARNGMNSTNQAIKSGVNGVNGSFSSLSKSMVSSVSNMFNTVVSNVKAGSSRLISTFKSMSSSINSILKSFNSQVKSSFNLLVSSIDSSSKKGANDVIKAFNDMKTKAISISNSLKVEVVSSLRGAYSGMYSAGSYAGSGFASGLASQRGRIMSIANSIANSVSATIRRALRVHSPSRVMRDIGKFTGEGLVLGLNDMLNPVKDVSFDMANSVMSIEDEINGFDFTPNLRSIKPSLSNVRDNNVLNKNDNVYEKQPLNMVLKLGNSSFKVFCDDIFNVKNRELELKEVYDFG